MFIIDNMNLVKISLNDKDNDNSYKYWNDKNIEKTKAYNVLDYGLKKLNSSKKIKYHLDIIKSYIKLANFDFRDKNIFSLASGICYIEAVTLRKKDFNKLTCIDFSKHRIHELAPMVFNEFDFTNKQIELIEGNFDYFKTHEKYDLAIMSKALHHFNEPVLILKSVHEMLNVNGLVIILGEPHFSNLNYFVKVLKFLTKFLLNYKNFREKNKFNIKYSNIFKKSHVKGDHNWSNKDYVSFFQKANFKLIESTYNNNYNEKSYLIKKW